MSSDLIANGGSVCLWRADGMKRQQFDHHRNSKPPGTQSPLNEDRQKPKQTSDFLSLSLLI